MNEQKKKENILTQFDVDFGVHKATRNLCIGKKQNEHKKKEVKSLNGNPKSPNPKTAKFTQNNNKHGPKYYLELNSDVCCCCCCCYENQMKTICLTSNFIDYQKSTFFYAGCVLPFLTQNSKEHQNKNKKKGKNN